MDPVLVVATIAVVAEGQGTGLPIPLGIDPLPEEKIVNLMGSSIACRKSGIDIGRITPVLQNRRLVGFDVDKVVLHLSIARGSP